MDGNRRDLCRRFLECHSAGIARASPLRAVESMECGTVPSANLETECSPLRLLARSHLSGQDGSGNAGDIAAVQPFSQAFEKQYTRTADSRGWQGAGPARRPSQ
jgi:hypothetical protein